jgi:hypothetical protein
LRTHPLILIAMLVGPPLARADETEKNDVEAYRAASKRMGDAVVGTFEASAGSDDDFSKLKLRKDRSFVYKTFGGQRVRGSYLFIGDRALHLRPANQTSGWARVLRADPTAAGMRLTDDVERAGSGRQHTMTRVVKRVGRVR